MTGKQKCRALRAIREQIAAANEIDYSEKPCTHTGKCAGTLSILRSPGAKTECRNSKAAFDWQKGGARRALRGNCRSNFGLRGGGANGFLAEFVVEYRGAV